MNKHIRSAALILLFFLLFSATCNPPPVVDLPASSLDVKLTIPDFDNNPSDGKVPVIMQFFSDGKYVTLLNSVSVTCNGVVLTENGLGYAERVPMVTAGGQYIFRHQRNGTVSTVSVTVPSRPVITSPAQNASVTRTTSLTINYVAGTGTEVKGSAGTASKGISGNAQPDNGAYTGLDVSTLPAEAGRVGINREINTTLSSSFRSAVLKYTSGSDHNVTWN